MKSWGMTYMITYLYIFLIWVIFVTNDTHNQGRDKIRNRKEADILYLKIMPIFWRPKKNVICFTIRERQIQQHFSLYFSCVIDS